MQRVRLTAALVATLLAGCTSIAEIDGWFGQPQTMRGAVIAFLDARRDGHDGEKFWRDTVPGFTKMPEPLPLSPTEWSAVLDEARGYTALFRYRIESSNEHGVPIRRLWDFCVIRTTVGPRLVASWVADDMNVTLCHGSNDWPKYQYRK